MNDEKSCDDFVHCLRFGKSQGLPHEARTGLSQGIVPTFHVVGLPTAFTDTLMGLGGKDQRISVPEIAVTAARPILAGNLCPEFAAGGLTPIPDHTGNDLACPPTHHGPHPTFVPTFVDKRPYFIRFQDVVRLGREKRLGNSRVICVFFLAK